MTRQRWWGSLELRSVRLGVDVGLYHYRASYAARYLELRAAALLRPLSGYERGLVSGYESASRAAFRAAS